jgi:serine/threonine protein kinase
MERPAKMGMPSEAEGYLVPLRTISATVAASMTPVSKPHISDHELFRLIGRGSYGEVWLARSVVGTFRAVKVVYRNAFDRDRPYEREFAGMQKFDPISRSHEGLVDILQIGRNEARVISTT